MLYRILALAIAFALMGISGIGTADDSAGVGSGRRHVSATTRTDVSAITLGARLRAAARRTGVPRPVIKAFRGALAYKLDLEQTSTPSSSFKLLYTRQSQTDNRRWVLSAGVLASGKDLHTLYRFQTSDGTVDYYDENGRSVRTALLRKPVRTGRLDSGFGERAHPLLGTVAMHTGVDWKGPYGSEVRAAGDGIVEKAGWEGGYGRYVRLRHADGYETAYAHLSQLTPRVVTGAHVQQGEVIGAVGSSGRSTGAHLHYELLVNGRFVDPMRVRLPHRRVLDGVELAAFENRKHDLDRMLARLARDHCDHRSVPIHRTIPGRSYVVACGRFR